MKKRTGKLALALAALAMLVTTIGCKDPNNGVKTVEEETKSYTVTFNTNGGSAIEAVSVDEGNTLTLPDDPTKTGYDFKGWFTDDALSAEFDETVAITADTTLYAKWAVTSYTITYVLNDEKATNAAANPATYTIESEDITLADPTTENTEKPHFAGWYSDETCETAATGITKGSTGNKTFYAKWSDKLQYTVTFYNGETSLGTAKVTEGEKVTIPSTIAVEGYTIEGWYTDSALTKAFDANSAISADTALYAKLIAKVTVIFKNGDTVVNTQTVSSGTKVTAPAAPEKTGYTFGGWVSGETTLAAGAESAAITADVTYTAKWTINKYTVTFYTNGGSDVESTDVNYGTSISLVIPETDPTKTGYTFDGWYTDEALENILDISGTVTSPLSLYAKWVEAATGNGTSYEDLAAVTSTATVYTSTPSKGNCLIWFKGVSGEVKVGDRIRFDFTISSDKLTNYQQLAIQTNVYEGDWAGATNWLGTHTNTSITWGATITADKEMAAGYHNFAIYIGNQVTSSSTAESFTITGLTVRNYGAADEGLVYQALGTTESTVTVGKNYKYNTAVADYSYTTLENFQKTVGPLVLDTALTTSDTLKVQVSGTCTMAVPALKVQIVDTSKDANWWTTLSTQSAIVSDITSTEEFSGEISLPISTASAGPTSVVLCLSIDKTALIASEEDFDVSSADPVFSFTTLKVIKE